LPILPVKKKKRRGELASQKVGAKSSKKRKKEGYGAFKKQRRETHSMRYAETDYEQAGEGEKSIVDHDDTRGKRVFP